MQPNNSQQPRLPRLFVGLKPGAKLTEHIRQFCATYEREFPWFKWTGENDLHITVLFLGPSEERTIPGMIASLKTVAEQSQAFSLSIAHVLPAPHGPMQRMVWVAFEPSDAFTDLVRRTAAALNYQGALSTEPHITLARFRPTSSPPTRFGPLAEYGETFFFDSFSLIQTMFRGRNVLYRTIQEFPFSS